jgi:hypothetical protein
MDLFNRKCNTFLLRILLHHVFQQPCLYIITLTNFNVRKIIILFMKEKTEKRKIAKLVEMWILTNKYSYF